MRTHHGEILAVSETPNPTCAGGIAAPFTVLVSVVISSPEPFVNRFTFVCGCFIYLWTGGATVAMAQPSTPEEWDRAKKMFEAEKAALEAQKQLLDARKALESAQAGVDPAKKAIEEQLAAAKAAKEMADYRKSQAEAELAALKTKFDVPASAYTGAVTVGTGAGSMEATLLAAEAARTAAGKIAAVVVGANPGSVLVIPSADLPNFQALLTFRLNKEIFVAALEEALREAAALEREFGDKYGQQVTLEAVSIPAIGLGLEALNKIVSFFKTDFSIGNLDTTVDDFLLVSTVVGELATKKVTARTPALYNRAAIDTAGTSVLADLRTVTAGRAEAQDRLALADKASTTLAEAAAKETDPGKKKALEEFAKKFKNMGVRWKSVVTTYDGLFGKLAVADDKGTYPAAVIIKESAIADALAEPTTSLLLLKVHKAGGAYFTQKNLWTAFGKMPFSVAGGVVASFILLQGKTGNVLAAGAVPVHGGYQSISKVNPK